MKTLFTSLLLVLLFTYNSIANSYDKAKVIIMSDIGGTEPDDQESFVRFLLYSNELDIIGLIGANSQYGNKRGDTAVFASIIDVYEKIRPNLLVHAEGYPTAVYLRSITRCGQRQHIGMSGVGAEFSTNGSQFIISELKKNDNEPIWFLAWGGINTLSQALWELKYGSNKVTDIELSRILKKIRIYDVAGQDNSGAWIAYTFPGIFYLRSGNQFRAFAYRRDWQGMPCQDGDLSVANTSWFEKNVKNHGEYGKKYPYAVYMYEGDSPSFLYLIKNGLSDPEYPHFGSWGGRFNKHTDPQPERYDKYEDTEYLPAYVHNNAIDNITFNGEMHKTIYTPIWRWRQEYQNDFATRMDWTLTSDFSAVNHAPNVIVNEQTSKDVMFVKGNAGKTISMDASQTHDPDGNNLQYSWWNYFEAGTYASEIEVESSNSSSTTFAIPEDATEGDSIHIILSVKDDGEPALTAYKRIVVVVTEEELIKYAPSNLKITEATKQHIIISWSDNSSNETGFVIERKNGNGIFEVLAETKENITSFTDTAIQINNNYEYRIATVYETEKSNYSNTIEIGTYIPQGPIKISTNSVTDSSAVILWNTSDIIEYTVERSTDDFSNSDFISFDIPGKLTDFNLMPHTLYKYKITAYNTFGSIDNTIAIKTFGIPTSVEKATINNLTYNSLQLSWNSNNDTTTTAYIVKRSNNNASYSTIAETNASTFSIYDEDLIPATEYSYIIYAKNQFGISKASTAIVAKTEEEPITEPFTLLIDFANTSATSPWNSSSFTKGQGVVVADAIDSKGNNSGISVSINKNVQSIPYGSTTSDNSGAFPDAVLKNGYWISKSTKSVDFNISGLPSAYKYRIKAIGSRSGMVDDRISILSSGSQSDSYNATSNTNDFALLKDLFPNAEGELIVTLTCDDNSKYAYVNGLEIQARPIAKDLPTEPSNITNTEISQSSITLQWSSSKLGGEPESYIIERAENNGEFKQIAEVDFNDTIFNDENLQPGTTYKYSIYSKNDKGISSSASVATITTLQTTEEKPYVVLLDFGNTSADIPWNSSLFYSSSSGLLFSDVLDTEGNATNINVTVSNKIFGISLGTITGNNSGLYPDNVLKKGYSINSNADTVSFVFSNLKPDYIYDFKIIGSRSSTLQERISSFTIEDVTDSIDASNNTNEYALLKEIHCNENGNVILKMACGNNSPFAYINALELQAYPKAKEEPLPPNPLSIKDITHSSITIEWQVSEEGEKAESYILERAYSDSIFELLVELPSEVNSFIDEDLSQEMTYLYRVISKNSYGVSQPTQIVSGTTKEAPAPEAYSVLFDFANTNASLPWNKSEFFSAGTSELFTNVQNTKGNDTNIKVTTDGKLYGNSYGTNTGNNTGSFPDEVLRNGYWISKTATSRQIIFSGLEQEFLYDFKVIGSRSGVNDSRVTIFSINSISDSIDASNNVNEYAELKGVEANTSGIVLLTISCGENSSYGYINGIKLYAYPKTNTTSFVPISLSTTDVSNSSITLQWNKNTEATSYIIKRADEAGIYNHIAEITSDIATYKDKELLPDTEYSYVVIAKMNTGMSYESNTVTETTNKVTIQAPVTILLDFANTQAEYPWNSSNFDRFGNGDIFTEIFDTEGNKTAISITTPEVIHGNKSGVSTGNDSGVFPDEVLKTAYWVSESEKSKDFIFTGLDNNYYYSLKITASRSGVSSERTSTFIVGSITESMDAASNSEDFALLEGIEADEKGTFILTVMCPANSPYAYINGIELTAIPKTDNNAQNKSLSETNNQNNEALQQTSDEFSIYPTLVSNTLTISSFSTNYNNTASVTIISANGNIVYSNTINESTTNINLPTLIDGIYYVQIHSKGNVYNQSIIIKQ